MKQHYMLINVYTILRRLIITPEYRFFQRNEIPTETRNILKTLDVSEPKRIVELEKR